MNTRAVTSQPSHTTGTAQARTRLKSRHSSSGWVKILPLIYTIRQKQHRLSDTNEQWILPLLSVMGRRRATSLLNPIENGHRSGDSKMRFDCLVLWRRSDWTGRECRTWLEEGGGGGDANDALLVRKKSAWEKMRIELNPMTINSFVPNWAISVTNIVISQGIRKLKRRGKSQ